MSRHDARLGSAELQDDGAHLPRGTLAVGHEPQVALHGGQSFQVTDAQLRRARGGPGRPAPAPRTPPARRAPRTPPRSDGWISPTRPSAIRSPPGRSTTMLAVRPGWSTPGPDGSPVRSAAADDPAVRRVPPRCPWRPRRPTARVGDAQVGGRAAPASRMPTMAVSRGRWARRSWTGPCSKMATSGRRWRSLSTSTPRSPGSSDRRSSEWSRVTGLMARMVAVSPGSMPSRAWSSGPMRPCVTTSVRPRPDSRSRTWSTSRRGSGAVAGHRACRAAGRAASRSPGRAPPPPRCRPRWPGRGDAPG